MGTWDEMDGGIDRMEVIYRCHCGAETILGRYGENPGPCSFCERLEDDFSAHFDVDTGDPVPTFLEPERNEREYKMSENEKSLAAHLADIMSEVGYVQKDARNDHFKYSYASADAVMSKVREACSKRGIGIVGTQAFVVSYENNVAVVKVTQTYGLGDQRVSFEGLGSGKDSGDKAIMKANTAALKYLLSLAFNISWGDDPEADSSVDKEASEPQKRPSARRQAEPAPSSAPTAEDFEKMVASASAESQLDAVRDALLKVRKDIPGELFEKVKNLVIEKRKALQDTPF